jgi:hypothetical protein
MNDVYAKRIEIYRTALNRIGVGVNPLGDDLYQECEMYRGWLVQYTNDVRQTREARIARAALKEASLIWPR